MHRHVLFTLALLLVAVRANAQTDPWFARDKALHAAAGAAIGAGGYGVGALVFESSRARIGTGLGLALGAGAAKEWYDRGGRGTPSWRDFAWDGVGAAAGVGVAWMIDRVRHRHSSASTRRDGVRARPMASGAIAPSVPATLSDVGPAAARAAIFRPYLGVEAWPPGPSAAR